MDFGYIRLLNLILTAIGAAVFVALFAYVKFAPEDFDQRTRDFAISKIESEVEEGLRDMTQSDTAESISEFAGRFSGDLQGRIDVLREGLDQGLDETIADILAAACRLDCERREQARQAVEAAFQTSILRYAGAIERVEKIVVGEYDDVMAELRSDLTIFSGSNGVALLFAFLLSVFRGPAAKHLLPISILLTGATALMICWYIFGQDWVMTIIFSNYWGWAYSIGLGVLSIFMIDIAAFRAQLTSIVLNSIGNAVGGSANFSPC